MSTHSNHADAGSTSSITARLSIALAATAPTILATAFLVGSTPDEEEFRWGVLASFLHIRALAEGTFALWTPALGLGIPQPLVPNFHMHPLVPLLAIVSPITWVRLFYLAHTVLGTTGMWQVGRTLRLSPLTNAACVFTFLLATPTQNYVLSDFWPSHYAMWTSTPWLLLMAWRVLDTTARDPRRWSVMLGVCAGLTLANAHPGHVPVYATLVLAVATAQWRAVLARWRWLVVAAVIALAISCPNLVQLATERTVFDEDLGISKLPDPLPPSAAWDVFFRPFSRSERPWQVDVANGTRTLFFGGPFAVLSLLGLVRFGRNRFDLALGVVITSVLLFTPLLPITFASRYHIRDPLILCAIPLAGLAVDRLLRSRRTRPLAVLLLAAQIGVVTTAAWPFLKATWQPDARQAMWFHGATGDTRFVDSLLTLMSEPGRLVYSPQVDYEISERARLQEGLGVNALAYRGVSVVNGSFKGVSTDVLWPDDRLFYGRIRVPQHLIESDEGLDMLGIRYVLANRGEAVAPGLVKRGSMAKKDGAVLVLYENRDTWPGAFVIGDMRQELNELPLYSGCSNDRLLCKDLTLLARLGRPGHIEIARRGGHIDVDVDSANEPRLLVVVEMFRPEWTATADRRLLPTTSLGPGLLGITVPPGTTSIRLDYRPMILISAIVLAWSAMAGGLIALLLLSRLRRSRQTRAATTETCE